MANDEVLDEVLLPGWERLPGNEDRRNFARDKVSPVYNLVDDREIAEAKQRWIEITQEARQMLGHIILDDPDPSLEGHWDERIIRDALRDVMNHLFRSTNNESLQMYWRTVTNYLFSSE